MGDFTLIAYKKFRLIKLFLKKQNSLTVINIYTGIVTRKYILTNQYQIFVSWQDFKYSPYSLTGKFAETKHVIAATNIKY